MDFAWTYHESRREPPLAKPVAHHTVDWMPST